MRLWFARDSGISMREQLVTQVMLGILCDELVPGQRLPSTRDLARRFKLHANTISAGYRQLQREGWVDLRQGSGVYVREDRPGSVSPALALDQNIANLFRSARAAGTPLSAVRERLRHWIERQPPDHFLLIEPDEELRRIVVEEIKRALTLPVEACDLRAADVRKFIDGTIALAMPSKAVQVRRLLPPGVELVTLHVNSVPASLARYVPAPANVMVAVVSRWPQFLKLARTMLIASGFADESLIVRDARRPRWQRGLDGVAAIVCDSATGAELPAMPRVIQFHLLTDACLLELQEGQNLTLDLLKQGL